MEKTISFQHFNKASNIGLIVAGSALFLFQMHGFSHTKYSDDFPLNKDDHYHIHKDMKESEKTSVSDNYDKKIDSNKVIKEPKAHKHGNGSAHSH